MAILDDFRERYHKFKDKTQNKIREKYQEYKENAKINELKDKLKEINFPLQDEFKGIKEEISHYIHISKTYKEIRYGYHNFLKEWPLQERKAIVIATNLTFFFFSRGLIRKIRNPLIFTAFGGALIIPEIINKSIFK